MINGFSAGSSTPNADDASLYNIMKSVYRMQGVSGLFRGAYTRMIFQIPTVAITMSFYELFKASITTT